ncbi:hypothetical protein C2S51_026425 [Perilla frutescens var. frutescens]|nr:hypothetical protein C2S51_026425 [Perilla frutescens var. frutescens]
MAYNLQSLITILQQILNPEQEHWILDHHSKSQLESLLEKAASLKQILENSSFPKLESLESRIRDAAHKAEDLIESHMVDQMLRYKGTGFNHIQEIDSAIKKLLLEVIMEEMMMSSGSSSSGPALTGMQTDDDLQLVKLVKSALKMLLLLEVMEEMKMSSGSSSSGPALTGMQTDDEPQQVEQVKSAIKKLLLEIYEGTGITFVTPDLQEVTQELDSGMEQVVKLMAEHKISSTASSSSGAAFLPDPTSKNVVVGIDKDLLQLKDRLTGMQSQQLEIIPIVGMGGIDDIWSTECWDDIKRCFPDYNNGSRIVLTTRESYVARNVGTGDWQHELQLLKESESWNLLHRTVFGEEDCPDALEEIGRKIARDCGGLPLAINVIGGVLSKAEREIDVWEHVAKDVRATIAETDNHEFSNVLSLSYNHLPNNLKPCFLYMGAFPEDYEIKASRLICMWAAEGFLKSNGDKSLEEEAKDYLSALVERNLVLVRRKKYSGKPYGYGMHDLLREVCIRKANEEKFLQHVKNGSKVRLDNVRRLSVETSCGMKDVDAYASAVARSFICAAPNTMLCEEPSLLFSKLGLVRVLDVYETEFPKFPREIYQLVNLRYLAISWKSGNIPSGISTLRYLQTLIARVEWGDVPSEIWEMPELRHLKFDAQMYIEEGYVIKFVRKKLQTISYWVRITGPLIRRGFFKSIPNIKNLGLYFHELPSITEVVDLTHLHKLQTLRCTCISGLEEDVLQKLRFPSSLRKLTLYKCVIFGRFMRTLCALPNLEVLKIVECAFDEEEWEAAEGDEFGSLQYLELQDLKLVRWRADETNFPRLEQLLIYKCSSLEEIPSGIGEIPTLQLIHLYKCSPSAVASAKQIQEQQQSEFDNYDLKVQILN